MKRERIAERETFDTQKHDDVGWKSDNKCCHCGKETYYGFGATIDHFVPLSKGGLNRDFNLIMLCRDCNDEKGDKVVDLTYIKENTLKKPHYQALAGYYESYLMSFDFMSRNNMFACDYYEYMLVSKKYAEMSPKKQAKIKPFGKKVISQKATDNDFDKVCKYYAEYLQKYDMYSDMESVEVNIAFWMKYGSIYYIEDKGEIINMQAYFVRPASGPEYVEDSKYLLNMYIFSKYATETAYSITMNMIQNLPQHLIEEQHLPGIVLKLSMLEEDKLTNQIYASLVPADQIYLDYNGMVNSICLTCISEETHKKGGMSKLDGYKEYGKFMDSFGDILKNKKEIQSFKNTFPGKGFYWMLYDLFTPKQIRDMELIPKENKEVYENNLYLCDYQDKWESNIKHYLGKKHYKENLKNEQANDTPNEDKDNEQLELD